MRARVFILLVAALMLVASCAGQADNTFSAKSFKGATVGEKVAAAQTACWPDASIPCIIVIDPSLAAFPAGVMPTLCAQCTLQDWRGGTPPPKDWRDTTGACKAYRGEVNVLDCGGVADGAWDPVGCAGIGCYHGTNNTAAFRKAVAALPASGGVVRAPVSGTNIFMLGANYPYDTTDDCVANAVTGVPAVLNLPNFVTIQGAGRFITTIMAQPNTARARSCALISNTGTPHVWGVALRDVRIDGNENTDGSHNDFQHPNNNFGAQTNYLACLILNTGTQMQGPSFIADDFQITGCSGASGVNAGMPNNVSSYIAGQGFSELRNGFIGNNQWGSFVLRSPDSIFENVYWQSNGNWNNWESLIAYDGGTFFIANYFGGGGGGTAQVLGVGMQGSKFDSCVFDNTGAAQVRLIDDGGWYSSYNTFVNSVLSQSGAFGTPSPFFSLEGHTNSTSIIGAFFSTGPAGHSTYAVQELGNANSTLIMGAIINPSSPMGTGNFNLIGSLSRVIGSVNAVDSAYTSGAYKGPNANQILADDGANGGWNIGAGASSSYGFRFWLGAAGTTKLGQLDQNGNFWISSGTAVVYRCATAGALPVGALTITAASCGTTTDTGLRTK